MKKIFISIFVALFIGMFYVQTALAAGTALVYVSPSSQSVSVGQSFSVSLRISSGSDKVDTATISMSFTSSRIQYTGYSDSGAAFTSFSTSGGGSSFSTTRVKYGGYTTGDQKLVTVNFKALSAGSSSLSITSASSAYSGAYLTTTKSNGTVSIANASSGSSGGSTSSGSTGASYNFSSGTTSSDPKKDTTPAKVVGEPTITPNYGNIKVGFKSSEDAKAFIKYGTSKRDSKSAETKLSKSHEIIIGKDAPLVPGTKYSFTIELTDKDGNKSSSKVFTKSTKGYTVELTITDSKGNVVANQDVTLHSDPMQAKTDSNGVVKFNDVAPGKHTVAFMIDGVTVERELTVANSLNLSDNDTNNSSADQKLSIKLPFSLNASAPPKAKSISPLTLVAIGMGGLIVGIVITLYRRQIINEIKKHSLNFHEWHKKKLDI